MAHVFVPRRARHAPDVLALLAALVALAACTRAPSESSSARSASELSPVRAAETSASPPPVAPTSAPSGDRAGAAVKLEAKPATDAAPAAPVPEAAPAPETNAEPAIPTYASIEEFLAIAGAEPPGTLAGYKLGDSATAGHGKFVVVGFGMGNLHVLKKDASGKLRHIGFELWPGTPDPDSPDGYRYISDSDMPAAAIAAVEVKVKARQGNFRRSGRGHLWQGKKSQLFLGTYNVDLRDETTLMVDLLPAGDEHVCGSRDGFRAYYKKFRKQLDAALKNDAAALTGLLDPAADSGMSACGDSRDSAELAECAAPILTTLRTSKAALFCNLIQEAWYWSWEPGMGGSYVEFRRNDNDKGKWQAYGPYDIDHAGGPMEYSP
jgi:hypothetical protein